MVVGNGVSREAKPDCGADGRNRAALLSKLSQGLSGRIGRSWDSVYDPSRSVQIVERGVWNVHFEQPATRLDKTAGCQIS